MSANISAVPSSAPTAATALTGNGDGNMSSGSGDVHGGNGVGPFAAIFQKLQGMQAGSASAALTQQAILAAVDEPAVDLNALLPFLEAMGITQSSDETSTLGKNALSRNKHALTADDVAESGLAVLAGPAIAATTTDPAISAESESAITGKAISSLVADQPSAALSATAKNVDESSAGREFAAQLVAAIKENKDQPHTSGDTADAVHQVIANASPANNLVKDTANAANSSTSSTIAQPVGSAGWSDEVGNRMLWMANQKDSHAELVLTPPQMGRIEVSLSVSGDKAIASFVSANPAVREALEAAMPRLREILADAGIQLGQAQVGAENAHQSAQQEKNGDNFAFGREARLDANNAMRASDATQSASTKLKVARGLVDVFA